MNESSLSKIEHENNNNNNKTGEMAQSVTCLLSKNEDLSLISSKKDN